MTHNTHHLYPAVGLALKTSPGVRRSTPSSTARHAPAGSDPKGPPFPWEVSPLGDSVFQSRLHLGPDFPYRKDLSLGVQTRVHPPGPLLPKFRLCSSWPDGSDLGSPTFDELHDLLDLKLGKMKVISQDVLTELHKDASVNAFSGKEAHHVL